MKIFFLLFFLLWMPQVFASGPGCIEVDLNKNVIHLENLTFEKIKLQGDFTFNLKKEGDSLMFLAQGRNIRLNSEPIDLLDIELVKKGEFIFINKFCSPEFKVRGWFNSGKQEFSVDTKVKSNKSQVLGENIEAEFKTWGGVGDFLVSGWLTVKNGEYKGEKFSLAAFHFLGKPPLLNITDSELILGNGNVYRIEGVMDIANFSNLFPGAEFVSRKVSIGGWEFLSDSDKNIRVKKDVDEKIKVLFDSHNKDDSCMNTGAEMRYKLKDDRFLRMRMQEGDTIVGFENRKEF